MDLETRVFALEEALARLLAKPEMPEPKRRWDKRKLFDAIKPLRATGASWDNIGAAVGVCGERCRQVWRLFDGDNVGKTNPVEVNQKIWHDLSTDRWVK